MKNNTIQKFVETLVNNWTVGHSMLLLICMGLLLVPILVGRYLDLFSNIALYFFGISFLITCIMDAVLMSNDDCD